MRLINLIFCAALLQPGLRVVADTDVVALRQAYAKPIAQWPAAHTQQPVAEMAPLPDSEPVDVVQQAKIGLGKQLFFDPLLSKDRTISCGSCHQADKLFGDGRSVGIGVRGQTGQRNTPPLFELQLWQSFFWDGRSPTLKHQVLEPVHNPVEMDLPISAAVARVAADKHYQQQFQQLYGREVDSGLLADALASFAASLRLPATKFEQFLRLSQAGQTKQAAAVLTDQELLGLHLFRTKAGCMNCHQGALLSDNQFHVTGLHMYGRRFEDLGRYRVTGKAEDSGKFRTASLRGVSQSGPWMHHGLFTEFDGIISLYDAGGLRTRLKPQPGKPMPQLSPLLHKLGLNKAEKQAITAFMRIL